jgi:hypothetical protein
MANIGSEKNGSRRLAHGPKTTAVIVALGFFLTDAAAAGEIRFVTIPNCPSSIELDLPVPFQLALTDFNIVDALNSNQNRRGEYSIALVEAQSTLPAIIAFSTLGSVSSRQGRIDPDAIDQLELAYRSQNEWLDKAREYADELRAGAVYQPKAITASMELFLRFETSIAIVGRTAFRLPSGDVFDAWSVSVMAYARKCLVFSLLILPTERFDRKGVVGIVANLGIR